VEIKYLSAHRIITFRGMRPQTTGWPYLGLAIGAYSVWQVTPTFLGALSDNYALPEFRYMWTSDISVDFCPFDRFWVNNAHREFQHRMSAALHGSFRPGRGQALQDGSAEAILLLQSFRGSLITQDYD
jgi:hypothetical protein